MAGKLPQEVARFIDGAPLTRDRIGESPCRVSSFYRGKARFFLKSSPAIFAATTYGVHREAAVLQWLSGKLGVPEVVMTAQNDAAEYMVTRAVPGRPLSAIADETQMLALFVEALRQVQSVPVGDCPFDASAAMRLRELDYLLAHGLAADDIDLQQWPGLHTPGDLRQRLHATVPVEDLVFSHGDLGDSNVFVDVHEDLHFIDVGRSGKADRWLDIAFIHRHLRDESPAALAVAFLRGLDRPDEPAKRLFYEQLDELF
jgi:aminoglycoside phosphotransferase